jgi:hypothetical protein
VLVSEHRETNKQYVAHLAKGSLADHLDCPEVIETQLRAAESEKGRLLLSMLQELPLLPFVRHH